MDEHPPKILAHEEKATTTLDCLSSLQQSSVRTYIAQVQAISLLQCNTKCSTTPGIAVDSFVPFLF